MVKIRLARGGFKKNPFYYIVVADSRNPRDGKFIDRIGFFKPTKWDDKNKNLYIDLDKVRYWLSNGAKSSNRVTTLIKKIEKNTIK